MNTNSASGKPRVALIAGPTASGKSALALILAERTGGTIVNADASQVYRDLPILSAAPTPTEQARVPHRLFGYVDAAEACSAARWAGDAKAALAEIWGEGGLPILVGGSGLYIRTLLDGIAPVPPIDPAVREAVRALPQEEARAALEREDAAAASRLHPSDATRTTRALEVARATGRTLAAWQEVRSGGIASAIALAPLIVMPNRALLYERCDRRFAAMVDMGAVDEVRRLLSRGLDPALPAMRAIGVRELAGFVRGERIMEEAVTAGCQATRNYAKRQFTWFSHQPPQEWPTVTLKEYSDQTVREAIIGLDQGLTRQVVPL